MITIREILALCKDGHLQNVRFIPHDSSLVPITVNNEGVPYFIQSARTEGLFELSADEIKRIDKENSYFCTALWDEMAGEQKSDDVDLDGDFKALLAHFAESEDGLDEPVYIFVRSVLRTWYEEKKCVDFTSFIDATDGKFYVSADREKAYRRWMMEL